MKEKIEFFHAIIRMAIAAILFLLAAALETIEQSCY